MERKTSFIDRLMRPDHGTGRRADALMKKQQIARDHIRIAARYLPEHHPLHLNLKVSEYPLHLQPGITESDVAREQQRNLELAAEVEKAGNEIEVRPAFWRHLVKCAAHMGDRPRAERYEECFHKALTERRNKRPQDEG